MTSETSEPDGCAYGRETRAILRGIKEQFTTITSLLKQMVANELQHMRDDQEKMVAEMGEIRRELSQTKKDSRRTVYLVLATIIGELATALLVLTQTKILGG